MPRPFLDAINIPGKITRMLSGFIRNAMRDAMKEWLDPQLTELKGSLRELDARLDTTNHRIDALGARLDNRIDAMSARLDERMDALGARLDGRIDETNQSVKALGIRLDGRIDETNRMSGGQSASINARLQALAEQQGRMVEEVAALKRDKKFDDDLVHRISRIEDRMFARAG